MTRAEAVGHAPPCRVVAGLALMLLGLLAASVVPARAWPPQPRSSSVPGWRIPGTGQVACYDASHAISPPSIGRPFHGQDAAEHPGPALAYRDHGDGTISDLVTGLMWTRALDGPLTWSEAGERAAQLATGGYKDWRVPSIKELYSLMDFRGQFSPSSGGSKPFIDTRYFDFSYRNDPQARFFDVQLWSSTPYVARTMNNSETIFGVNFADGRIKGYPLNQPGRSAGVPRSMHCRYVRGPRYGENAFRDNGDGTVTDLGSGLMWQQGDDGVARNWRDALSYCEHLDLAGYDDWRLPNAKELQSIVDYTKAPATHGTAALAPPLEVSQVESYFWSSTTILDGPEAVPATRAVYVAFGRALGWMALSPNRELIDVHGAGAQRADLKQGDPAVYPHGLGPQGDDVRIRNAVRAVRGGR